MDDLEQAAVYMRARPFVWFIRAVLSGLLLLILATLVGGILAVGWELRRLFVEDVELVLRHVLDEQASRSSRRRSRTSPKDACG